MGAYLDTPVTDKNPENGANEMVRWGLCSMQGWRCGMEDDHIAKEIQISDGSKAMLFSVFDGHGGKEVANYSKENFTEILKNVEAFKAGNYKEALIEAFRVIDSQIKDKEYGMDTGSTSNVVLITKDTIFCANAGDSRAVLYSNDRVYPLSDDHKPDKPTEKERITKSDHMVSDDRVDGNLALSRAFGDFQYKQNSKVGWKDQAVTAHPDVSVTNRKKGDKFVIMACDGIWDCVTNEQCCQKFNDYQSSLKTDSTNTSKLVEKLFE